MITIVSATVECHLCPREFHQIDTTRERALQVVNDALCLHLDTEHPERWTS